MAENAYRAGPWAPRPGDEVLHAAWGWYVALGIVLIGLGILALGATSITTFVSVLVFGWALIVGGVLQAGHAFWRRQWSGFFLDLATGLLYFVVGLMMISRPLESAVALTLILAVALVVGGMFRVIATASHRFPGWGWRMLHGIVSIVLGAAIWAQWPFSGVWVLGVFVGIDMIFDGVALAMLGLGTRRLRQLPREEEPRPTRPFTEAPAH